MTTMTTSNQDIRAFPGPDTITRTTLDNGITVLVYENHSAQSVVLSGSLHAGSIYETPARAGLASLVSGALMRGTQSRDFDAVHSGLEDIGADLDLSAGNHRVGFGGKALAEDLPTLLDILADVLRHAVFPDEQIERLRGERMTWLRYRQQDTRWQAARLFRENLYPGHHPYHHAVRGTPETLAAITVEEMRDFHRRNYGPQGMILVIVGAVDSQAAVGAVQRCLGDWRNPDQPSPADLPEVSPPAEPRRESVTVPGKTQSDLVIGSLGPSRYAEDYQAANLANSVLGQFGLMGRVGEAVRERSGLAYYAYSRLEGGFGPGGWSVSAGVNPANIERAIELCAGKSAGWPANRSAPRTWPITSPISPGGCRSNWRATRASPGRCKSWKATSWGWIPAALPRHHLRADGRRCAQRRESLSQSRRAGDQHGRAAAE
jgi:zinc protease